MKGKSAFGAPSMKDKSVDLPREGKKVEKTSASIQFSIEKFLDYAKGWHMDQEDKISM